jgi:autotransporter-associated beta strand protein
VINSASRNYTFAGTGTLDGAMQLVKSDESTLTMASTGTSTYTGGTLVTSGVLALVSTAPAALGTGNLTLSGGTLDLGVGASESNALVINGNAIVRSTNGNVTLVATATNSLSSVGTANLTFQIPAGICTINGPMDNYSGTIALATSAGQLRLNGTSNANFGSAKAHFDLGTSYGSLSNRNGALTMSLGAVSGGPNTTLQGRQNATGDTASTYLIGALNLDTTFAGHLSNGGDNLGLNITKIGTGKWTLTGTSSFTGDVSLQEGQISLSGNLSNVGDFLAGADTTLRLMQGTITTDRVEVAATGLLIGCGTINGGLENHGTVDIDCINGLTVTGDVSNDGLLRITHGARLNVGGTMTNRGTIDLIGSPATSLPAGFVNEGTVLDSTAVKVQSIAQSETTMSIAIQTYAGHTYTLQSNSTLTGTWSALTANVATMTDSQGVKTWTITGQPAGSKFYRISVGP